MKSSLGPLCCLYFKEKLALPFDLDEA